MQPTLKIEIWSDILCPFCYIGKRNLEKALQLVDKDKNISIEWRSYQLDPEAISDQVIDVYDYLAKRKGQSRDWSVAMHQQVANTAKEAGLEYNFDKAIVANSYKAHRILHLAKKYNLANQLKEIIFKAYFTNGKNIANNETLIALGTEAGLPEEELISVLNSTKYDQEVKNDILEAQEIGVRGVPFFVFNRTYAVSGAQPVNVFLETIKKASKN